MNLMNVNEVPVVPTDQMKEIDDIMINKLGISLLQMMENAGRNLARLACKLFLGNHPQKKKIVIFTGSGGNGGGGMVCARFLHNWGADVLVMVTKEKSLLKEGPKKQLEILNNMGIKYSKKLSLADDFKKQAIMFSARNVKYCIK
jgi:NAD(P)H-hydrate epimerase